MGAVLGYILTKPSKSNFHSNVMDFTVTVQAVRVIAAFIGAMAGAFIGAFFPAHAGQPERPAEPVNNAPRQRRRGLPWRQSSATQPALQPEISDERLQGILDAFEARRGGTQPAAATPTTAPASAAPASTEGAHDGNTQAVPVAANP